MLHFEIDAAIDSTCSVIGHELRCIQLSHAVSKHELDSLLFGQRQSVDDTAVRKFERILYEPRRRAATACTYHQAFVTEPRSGIRQTITRFSHSTGGRDTHIAESIGWVMGSVGVGELRRLGNCDTLGANVHEEQGFVIFVR